MAISKPAGRIGATPDDTPAKEKRDRSGSGYEGEPKVSFGITGKAGMDPVPVAGKTTLEGTAPVPDLEIGEKAAN